MCDIDEIVPSKPNEIVCIAGDLNQLKTDIFESELCLVRLASQPTHGDRILEKFITNRPDVFHRCMVVRSLVPTKHKALVINCICELVPGPIMERRIISFYIRQRHIEGFRAALGTYNWRHIHIDSDLDSVYNAFLAVTKRHINRYVPMKLVMLTSCTPLMRLL